MSASDRPAAYAWSERLLIAAIVAWLTYAINGFRLPWSPILVSDADVGAGLRQVLFASAGLLAVTTLLLRRELGRAISRNIGSVSLGVALFATVLYSEQPTLTLKRAIIFNFGLLALIAIVHVSRDPLARMQSIVFGVAAAAAWISLLGWVSFPVDAVSIAERPGLAGVSGHPNTLAPVMVIGFLVSLGMPASVGIRRAAVRVGQGGQLVALVLSDSITSITMLLGGCFVFLVLTASNYRRGIVQLTLVVAIVAIAVVGPATAKKSTFAAAGRDESLSGRSELWGTMWEESMRSPLFGRGFGAFWYEGRGREIVGTWNPRQSHNAYLDVMVDLGAFGVTGVVLLFAGGFWVAWLNQRGRRSPGLASLIAVCALLMTLYAFGESYLLKLDKMTMFCLLWFRLLLPYWPEHE